MIDKDLSIEGVEKLFGEILSLLGWDWRYDENLKDTPKRVATLWCKEMSAEPESIISMTSFPEKHSSMIMVIGHTVWTRCPHHLERVKMRVSMGYLQGEYELVLGASKLPRLADTFAKGLNLQESYTDRVAEYLFKGLKAKGVGVHVIGQHHCMCARGVETDGVMITTALRGNFLEPEVKSEFLREVHNGRGHF